MRKGRGFACIVVRAVILWDSWLREAAEPRDQPDQSGFSASGPTGRRTVMVIRPRLHGNHQRVSTGRLCQLTHSQPTGSVHWLSPRLSPPAQPNGSAPDSAHRLSPLTQPTDSAHRLSLPAQPTGSAYRLSSPAQPTDSAHRLSPLTQPTDSAHWLSPPAQPTGSAPPPRLSPPAQPTFSAHRLSPLTQPTDSAHWLSPPVQPTGSAHWLSPPSQPTFSAHWLSPPAQSPTQPTGSVSGSAVVDFIRGMIRQPPGSEELASTLLTLHRRGGENISSAAESCHWRTLASKSGTKCVCVPMRARNVRSWSLM